MSGAHKSWQAEYRRLVAEPTRYRHLDAAQLVKHYLGLRNTFPGRRITLAYLYWTPSNASDLVPCLIHDAEVAEFTKRVKDPNVRFLAEVYRELWHEWSAPERPGWLREHASALRRRYDVAVTV